MSNIPYSFTPIPNYFRIHGWFNDPNCVAYVTWAFSRCSAKRKKILFSNKEIEFLPFEFISGLEVCSQETGLTIQEIRTQQQKFLKSGLLEKSTSKTTNKFTVYRWVTEAFSLDNKQINKQINKQKSNPKGIENDDFENDQQANQQANQQASNNKQEAKKKRRKEEASEQVASPLLYEENDFASLMAYIEDRGLVIFAKTLRTWLRKYPAEYIASHLGHLLSKKTKPQNDESWLEIALKNDYVGAKNCIECNRKFIEDFVSKKGWNDMKINKQYCTHLPSGNDYQFNLPQVSFREIIKHCYQKQMEAQ